MDDTLVFGIDFGTTHSGISYAHSSDRTRTETIIDWESMVGSISEKGKVPTCITYDDNGNVKGWGYSAVHDPDALRWFKLLLLRPEDLQQKYRGDPIMQQAKSLLRRLKKRVVEVVADFLRMLWAHALASIAKSESQSLLDMSRFKIVMTLPAIWPVYAQEQMKKATRLAGIADQRQAGNTILDFVAEPEAATLATLYDKFRRRKTLNVGDRFTVCDSGGGTSDLITYKCTKTCPLEIEEAIQGNGALCGGAWIDSAFEDFIKSKVGSQMWKQASTFSKQEVMRQWDSVIKPQFGECERDWDVVLPAALSQGLEETLKLPHITLAGIFDAKTKDIVSLVDGQVRDSRGTSEKPPKYIILVGGFGQSPYLYSQIRDRFKNIEVLQSIGTKPWTAISRGAVMYGFNNDGSTAAPKAGVVSRISRSSYGTICITVPFSDGYHNEKDREKSQEWQGYIAVNQVSYFLGIDSNMKSNKPIVLPFQWNLSNPNEVIEAELVYSNEDFPPSRRDETVKHLCTVRWTEDRPLWNDLPIFTNKIGHQYRTVHYELHLQNNGATLGFSIYYKGKQVGQENLDVDYAGSGNAPSQEEVEHDDSSDEDYSE